MFKLILLIFVIYLNNAFALTNKFYKYDTEFMLASEEYKVPFILLKAIALTENSKYNNNIKLENKNKTHDYGLMQINTIWLKEFKISENTILDPYVNISVAARILSDLIKKHGYSWETIGKYHSSTPKFKEKWLAKIKKNMLYIMKHDKKNNYVIVSRN